MSTITSANNIRFFRARVCSMTASSSPRNKFLALKDFINTIHKDETIFHAVRQRGMLFAQPVSISSCIAADCRLP